MLLLPHGLVQSAILGTSSLHRTADVTLMTTESLSLYLTYHTPHQILWGLSVGVLCGIAMYAVAELVPARLPNSLLGRLRAALLTHPVVVWLQVRDGWAIWPDGGHEAEWKAWRIRWEERERRVTGRGNGKKD